MVDESPSVTPDADPSATTQDETATPDGPEPPGAERAYLDLPVSAAADPHALIVTSEGVQTPSGVKRAGLVDSIEKLAKLIEWAALTPAGAPPQIWMLGDAIDRLGWDIDTNSYDDLSETVAREQASKDLSHVVSATLGPLHAAGWELRGSAGHRIHLSRTLDKRLQMVDIILEPHAWTLTTTTQHLGILGTESEDPACDTALPDDDAAAAAELGRRLAWSVEHLGALPGHTVARIGASIFDRFCASVAKPGAGRS